MDALPSSPDYKDRKSLLVLFGLFTVMFGLICGLMVPMMLFGQNAAAQSGRPQPPQFILPAVILYSGISVVFIWLGIGSIMLQRWARALLLIISWTWLLIGLASAGVFAFVMPQFLQSVSAATASQGANPTPPEAQTFIMIFTFGFLGIFFVILPAVWVLVYKSRNVKATCEANHPQPSWTDHCPLPVLAIALWIAFTGVSLACMAFSSHSVFAAFGSFVTGSASMLINLCLGALFIYCAFSIYKLRISALWTVLGILTLLTISAVLTYSRHDISELYELMGYPKEQIEAMNRFNFLKNGNFYRMSLLGYFPILGYLIYVRRFFPPAITSHRG